jgi:hypothetical protein
MWLFTPDETEVLQIPKRENVARFKGLLTAGEADRYHHSKNRMKQRYANHNKSKNFSFSIFP